MKQNYLELNSTEIMRFASQVNMNSKRVKVSYFFTDDIGLNSLFGFYFWCCSHYFVIVVSAATVVGYFMVFLMMDLIQAYMSTPCLFIIAKEFSKVKENNPRKLSQRHFQCGRLAWDNEGLFMTYRDGGLE